MDIPTWAQSSLDESEVSLTITSFGKVGMGVITFLAMVGLVDPTIAGEAWGGFVASVITAVPAAYAVWHASQGLWGVTRKLSVRLVAMFAKAPQQ